MYEAKNKKVKVFIDNYDDFRAVVKHGSDVDVIIKSLTDEIAEDTKGRAYANIKARYKVEYGKDKAVEFGLIGTRIEQAWLFVDLTFVK